MIHGETVPLGDMQSTDREIILFCQVTLIHVQLCKNISVIDHKIPSKSSCNVSFNQISVCIFTQLPLHSIQPQSENAYTHMQC